ncbi:MAG TPA: glycosyltransferase family 2 protein [Candidatus Acidoferrales bacterium]|nr:glycosyltransferase family 2 protein [Candidatus Acidoferrales bacterium]
MELSVVVPVYNEAENLRPLVEEIEAALGGMEGGFEVIIVDDGSNDGSFDLLRELHREKDWLKVIRLKRNFGQTPAVAAGLNYARGEIIVPMDGDGQNDPHDIPRLLAKLAEGFDLVCGWRLPRRDPYWSRRLPSHMANRLISWITGVKLHDYGCTLKAMRRELAKDLRLYGEMHRFIPALADERGARIAEIPVHHRPRRRGHSKYGLARTFRVLLDLLTVKFLQVYVTRPLHVFGLIGLASGLLGFVLGVYLSLQKFLYGAEIGGRPLLLLTVLLILIGFQFISLGLLGELLARTYHESQNKPIYVVGEILDRKGKR